MMRLKAALQRDFEDSAVSFQLSLPYDTMHTLFQDFKLEIYTPRNTQAVELYFRGEKMAKVMGVLASKPPHEGHKLSGVLVKRGFNYHLIDPSDLASESF